MSLHIFSLVLAVAAGWAVLALGYLPAAVLRLHGREALKAVGAWAVVAATAPQAVFHWYLIFALICLVAWTKLDRLAGKFWLAAAAALGLSLGVIFPLEIVPALLAHENPFALTSLYLGGAGAGMAYALFATTRSDPLGIWQHRGFARVLLPLSLAWVALLAARPYLSERFAIVPPQPIGPDAYVRAALVLGLGITQVTIAFFVSTMARQASLLQARILAGAVALLAFGNNLLTQLLG